MPSRLNRRYFLGGSAAAAVSCSELAALGAAPLLGELAPLAHADLRSDSKYVQFRPEIEPLVHLIETTPRERLLEEIGGRVRDGLNYQQLLAALFLAGIRNVQPRPAVGFKFHAVLVVNSAHLASLASPPADRWLPIFWSLDEFKKSQARDEAEGDWTMPAVDEPQVPTARQTESAFERAMEQWDEQAADTAATGVARHLGANRTLDLFARFVARDFRSIGHKAIYLANSWRTLQAIGWQHAEPDRCVYLPPESCGRTNGNVGLNRSLVAKTSDGVRVDPSAERQPGCGRHRRAAGDPTSGLRQRNSSAAVELLNKISPLSSSMRTPARRNC